MLHRFLGPIAIVFLSGSIAFAHPARYGEGVEPGITVSVTERTNWSTPSQHCWKLAFRSLYNRNVYVDYSVSNSGGAGGRIYVPAGQRIEGADCYTPRGQHPIISAHSHPSR